MENAENIPCPALPLKVSQGTLSEIESKIHKCSDKIKEYHDAFEEGREVDGDVWSYMDAMRRYQKMYFEVKERVDKQIAYQLEIKKRSIVLKDKRTSEDMGTYLFITINPDPSKLADKKGVLSFVAECRSFFRSYVFDVAEFVFEQRGKQEGDYPGVHCHGIVRRCDTPSKVRKEVTRRFIVSGICGNDKHVQIKTIDRAELNITRNYITGVKQGKNETEKKDKAEKQANDVFFRRDYQLESVYATGEGKLLVP